MLRWETNRHKLSLFTDDSVACGRAPVNLYGFLLLGFVRPQHNRLPATGLLELNLGTTDTLSSPDNSAQTGPRVSAWSPGYGGRLKAQILPRAPDTTTGISKPLVHIQPENQCYTGDATAEDLNTPQYALALGSRENDSACQISCIKIGRDKTPCYGL